MTDLTLKEICMKRIEEHYAVFEKAKEIFEPLKELFYTEIEQREEQTIRSLIFFKKEISTTKNYMYVPLDITYEAERGNFYNIIVSISFRIIETTNVHTKQKTSYKSDYFRNSFRITPERSFMSIEDLDKEIHLTSWILDLTTRECPNLRILLK